MPGGYALSKVEEAAGYQHFGAFSAADCWPEHGPWAHTTICIVPHLLACAQTTDTITACRDEWSRSFIGCDRPQGIYLSLHFQMICLCMG